MEAEQLRESLWANPKLPLSLEGEAGIEDSYKDPLVFWKSLNAISPSYDFYSDCVLRHPEANTALISIDEHGFIQNWTYKKLHRIVNFHATEWAKKGVQAGQLIAIVLPPGPDFLIALLTALRLGLTICYLAPGTAFLSQKFLLELLQPLKAAWNTSELPLDSSRESDQGPPSYAYKATDILQFSLSLHLQAPFSILPVTAEMSYLHALRDGRITLNLGPGVRWASFLSCPLRAQPCSTLMTLLSGATLFHGDPNSEKLDLLELSPAKPLQPFPKRLKGYYKSPVHAHSSFWKAFLEEVPFFHLLLDNSFGGALFFSKPVLKEFSPFFKPAPALAWQLKALSPASPEMGPFALKEKPPTNFILAHIDRNTLISGTVQPCKEGITLPVEKIEKAVSQLPFVKHCFLYSTLKLGEVATYRTTLLTFTEPGKPIQTEWTEAIQKQISEEVGSGFLPDQIEFYPLIPLDRVRCKEQFSQGLLNQKRSSPLYQLIHILKKEVIYDV